jgi:hypothetical protein
MLKVIKEVLDKVDAGLVCLAKDLAESQTKPCPRPPRGRKLCRCRGASLPPAERSATPESCPCVCRVPAAPLRFACRCCGRAAWGCWPRAWVSLLVLCPFCGHSARVPVAGLPPAVRAVVSPPPPF